MAPSAEKPNFQNRWKEWGWGWHLKEVKGIKRETRRNSIHYLKTWRDIKSFQEVIWLRVIEWAVQIRMTVQFLRPNFPQKEGWP